VNENPSYLGEENFGQVYGSNSISGEDMRQRKREQHSNQAQLTGEFMRQMWRIYGLSDMEQFVGETKKKRSVFL